MPCYICVACGTQFQETPVPPDRCPICEDERQYVNWSGQEWTTVSDLRKEHRNVFKEEEPYLTGIGTEPSFAIGQRALLVATQQGNFLWDCISLIDDPTVAEIKKRGGLSGIAISHPHFYSSVVEWSSCSDDAPIYLHAADKLWVMRPDSRIHFWEGDAMELAPGLTLIRCGGHFEGSTVLHWRDGAEGRGALLTGDTVYVVQDRRFVSFMRSYPNLIPLPVHKVQSIVDSLRSYKFDRIYSGWYGRVISSNAKSALERSASRYIRAID